MTSSFAMDSYESGRHKYIDRPYNQQPGLEVHTPPPGLEHDALWQHAKTNVWGTPNDTSVEEKIVIPERQKILGLSVGTFWGVIVVLCLIVAGGVGGGVGAGLATRKNTCSSVNLNSTNSAVGASAAAATKTITAIVSSESGSAASSTSTQSAATSSMSPAPSSLCTTSTSFNGTSITPLDAAGNPIEYSSVQQTFRVMCNTNWPGGASYGNPGVHDILKMYQPDLMHCVAACAEYNAGYQSSQGAGINVGGGTCKGVSLVLAAGEFCYLKNATGINDTSTSGGNRIDSAFLE